MRAAERSASIELDRTLTEREDRVIHPTGQKRPLKSALKRTNDTIYIQATSDETISNQGSTGGYCWLYAALSILIIGLVAIVLIHYKDDITHHGGTTVQKSTENAMTPVIEQLKTMQNQTKRVGAIPTLPPNFSVPILNFEADVMRYHPAIDPDTAAEAAAPKLLQDAIGERPEVISPGVASELDGLLDKD